MYNDVLWRVLFVSGNRWPRSDFKMSPDGDYHKVSNQEYKYVDTYCWKHNESHCLSVSFVVSILLGILRLPLLVQVGEGIPLGSYPPHKLAS